MTSPRVLHKTAMPLAATALALGFSGPTASAAVVGGAASVHTSPPALKGPQVRSFRTELDTATGTWTNRIVFASRPSASTAGDLGVNIVPIGRRLPTSSWAVRADPATIAGPASGDPSGLPSMYNGIALPTPQAKATFDEAGTTLTLSSVDRGLIGIKPDTVTFNYKDANTDGRQNYGTVFLGPTAPRSVLPAAAKRLVLNANRTVRVPLRSLPTAADRRITIYVDGVAAATRTVRAKDFRLTSAVARLNAASARRITRTKRVTVALRTSLENGSVTSTRVSSRLTRR